MHEGVHWSHEDVTVILNKVETGMPAARLQKHDRTVCIWALQIQLPN
jgi:hypothetical protein